MPNIKKKALREKPVPYKNEKREFNNSFYSSAAWHRLRNTYISHHPVCEQCLQFGRVNPAEHVHHRIPWQRGLDDKEKWELFLDENNLMSVCEHCHIALHNKDREYHLNSVDSLTETEWKYIHGLNYR